MIWEVELSLSLCAQDIYVASENRSARFRKIVAIAKQHDAFALPSSQVWPFPVEWTYPKTINEIEMILIIVGWKTSCQSV